MGGKRECLCLFVCLPVGKGILFIQQDADENAVRTRVIHLSDLEQCNSWLQRWNRNLNDNTAYDCGLSKGTRPRLREKQKREMRQRPFQPYAKEIKEKRKWKPRTAAIWDLCKKQPAWIYSFWWPYIDDSWVSCWIQCRFLYGAAIWYCKIAVPFSGLGLKRRYVWLPALLQGSSCQVQSAKESLPNFLKRESSWRLWVASLTCTFWVACPPYFLMNSKSDALHQFYVKGCWSINRLTLYILWQLWDPFLPGQGLITKE